MKAADAEVVGGTPWFACACTALLCLLTWTELAWLLWRYVPLHAALLAGLGLPLPFATRVTIVFSHWFIRYLPFGVVGAVVVGPVLIAGAAVLLARRTSLRRVVASLVLAGIVASFVGVAACGFIVSSIQMVYTSAALDPQVQENLRAFREFRAHRVEDTSRR